MPGLPAWLHAGTLAALLTKRCPGSPLPQPPYLQGPYSKAGSRTCTPCPPGTFNKLTAQGQCTTAGSFATGSGNKAQTPCPKGSYQDSTGKATCIKCPINTYQTLTGKTVCQTCCKSGTMLG